MVEVLQFAAGSIPNLLVTLLVMLVGGVSTAIALSPFSTRAPRAPEPGGK